MRKLFQQEDSCVNSHLWCFQRTRFERPEWMPTPKCASGGEGSPPSHPSAAVGTIRDSFVSPNRRRREKSSFIV